MVTSKRLLVIIKYRSHLAILFIHYLKSCRSNKFWSSLLQPSVFLEVCTLSVSSLNSQLCLKNIFCVKYPFSEVENIDCILTSSPHVSLLDWYFSSITFAIRDLGLLNSFHHHLVRSTKFILSNCLFPSPPSFLHMPTFSQPIIL